MNLSMKQTESWTQRIEQWLSRWEEGWPWSLVLADANDNTQDGQTASLNCIAWQNVFNIQ